MALFDYAAGEVVAKIVYVGPPRAGKTTNLRHIHAQLAASNKGELAIVTTETGSRALVFDFVASEPGRVGGLRMRVQLCSFSGTSLAALRAVLKGADGVVFVADSQAAALDADLQSLDSLHRHLTHDHGRLPPLVLQYNKRDLATALPVGTLRQRLNPRGVPSFEAIASEGIGVDETLRVITRACFRALVAVYEGAEVGDASRHARIRVSKHGLPGAAFQPSPSEATPPPPARAPTHHSLARKSLAGTLGKLDSRRTETLPLTKLEELRRAEAEPAEPPPTTSRPGTPPTKAE